MSEIKEYNLLILGETGVGKSTFINAFANYVKFSTLDDALEAEEIPTLIPSRFAIVDASFVSQEVTVGKHENESLQTGASSTQQCISYKFQFENGIIRIIDTPGVGDTRGIQKDEENFSNLLAYLGEFTEINAILIMLKPNESRLSVLFEYCIKQLLSSLERSAVDNIIFLFTNSRATFYRPGDTHGPLLTILKEISDTPPNVIIPYHAKNIFCLDSESFRFLLAKRQGCEFEDNAQKSFKESWNISVEVCKRLIDYVTGLKPHLIQNTVSVMDARRSINRLSKPLGEITELIENNIRRRMRLEENLSDTTSKIEDLAKYLYVPRINLKILELEHPRTVCAAQECTEAHKIEDSTKIHYKTICHQQCQLEGVPKEVLGDPRLQKCWAMEMRNRVATCWRCEHEYQQHMHIYYVTEPFEDQQKDDSVDKQITNKQIEQTDIEKQLEEYREERKEYEMEREVIQKAVAKFAHFLTNSVILAYNDTYEEYVNYLIEREKKLGPHAKQDVIKNFENILSAYEEEKNVLTRALENNKLQDPSVKTVVSAKDVINIVQELYKLKLTGEKIKELYNAQQRHITAEIVKQSETVISTQTVVDNVKNVYNWIKRSVHGKNRSSESERPTKNIPSASLQTTTSVSSSRTKKSKSNKKNKGTSTIAKEATSTSPEMEVSDHSHKPAIN